MPGRWTSRTCAAKAGLRRALVGGVGVLWVIGAAAKPSDRSDLRRWLDGPVRYLVTEDESRVFRALGTDDERTRFIDRFWELRDPLPETTENEYRALFWSRVKDANERFQDSAIPGWKTDRGKLHILCGPPSRIEDQNKVDTDSGATAGRGLIRWVYEGRPCGRRDLGPVVVIPFVRQTTGEYRLSYDPRLSSLYWNPDALRDATRQEVQRWLDFIAPAERTSLGVMADLGKLQEAPHPEDLVVERVETAETYGSHPLAVEVARFRHPRGGHVVVLTVAAPSPDGKRPPNFIARLAPRDPARTKRFLTEESFRADGEGDDRVSQARVALEPGTWDLTVLSSEPGSKTNGLHRGVVEIPAEPPPGLTISDVVRARVLEPLPSAALFSHDEWFLLDGFRVVPRPGGVVARGQPVALFFEVYGAAGPFRVEYLLEGREDDGRWTPLGKPSVKDDAQGAQGWSVDTSPGWPPGAYRVRVRVVPPDGAPAESIVPFELR